MSGQRLPRLLFGLCLLLGAGLAYAAFVTATGLFLPCPFRLVTGLLCPGCGVSHLCLALLRLDFPGAWDANAGLVLVLPILTLLLFQQARRYVTGITSPLPRWERILLWMTLIFLLIWGVVRNTV